MAGREGVMGHKGFSLIELMVVIAIVAVLSAVAVPAYRDYTARAKFAEILSFSETLQKYVQDYRNKNGSWPNSTSWTLVNSGNIRDYEYYVPGADTSKVYIHIRPNPGVYPGQVAVSPDDQTPSSLGPHLIIRGYDDNSGTFRFHCGYDLRGAPFGIPSQYLPASCQSQFNPAIPANDVIQ